jgi:hypothetical protein
MELKAPATYGGTVISCAFVLLKPIPLVIVGNVNFVPVGKLTLLSQGQECFVPYEQAEMQSRMYACMYRRQLHSTIFKSFHLKLSFFSSPDLPPSLMNRWSSRKRISSGSSHLPLNAGESMRKKKHETPRPTVTIPSSKNIHRQLSYSQKPIDPSSRERSSFESTYPSYPPIPSILAMAAASKPLNAPDNADAQ